MVAKQAIAVSSQVMPVNVLNPRFGQPGVELHELLTTPPYSPLSIPLFTIKPGQDLTLIEHTDYENALLIFTSRHAVEHWVTQVKKQGNALDRNVHDRTVGASYVLDQCKAHSIYAVGSATAKQLQSHGVTDVMIPKVASSEGILNDISLNVHNPSELKVVIIKGEQGRDHLESAFKQQGQQVSVLNVYKRVWQPLTQAQAFQVSHCTAWMITSGEMLIHLLSQLRSYKQAFSNEIKVLVPSERVKKIAQQNGLVNVINAESALNSVLVARLKQVI